ncbi:MAG TPA: outer membrane beta-barrel protein [Puia sp.]|nr:outer membrane beta-barrel protein [Puia sp.]
MKESNFYSDEFEQLIREKTEQYKMYPSEKVWKGIHGSLHTKRRWFIGSMSLLITGILFLAGKELIAPGRPGLSKKSLALNTAAGNSPSKADGESAGESLPSTSFSTLRPGPAVAAGRHSDAATDESSDQQPYKEITITISDPVIRQPDLSEILSHVVHLPSTTPALSVIAARGSNGNIINIIGEEKAGADNEKEYTDQTGMEKERIDGVVSGRGDGRVFRMVKNNTPSKNSLAVTRSVPEPAANAETLTDSAAQTVKPSPSVLTEAVDQQKANWLQDYAVYNLSPAAKTGRTFLQLYLSPTVNYRTLSGGDFAPPKSIVQNVPVSLTHIGDAKKYVDHTPALGFEVGSNLLYRVTRNLTLKAGLQFSFSRYKIKAYSSSPQQATIALNSYYGYYLDSITAYSSIRNFGGKTVESLNNDYYQLSAPMGFELRILGNERLQLNIAATIQPTYLLNTNSYLLTTDYTNYTKEPSLFRRWNVNGGLETYLSYKFRNGIRWQIGPEFRYQLLSTYSNQYPIHENLKGYGFKIGFTRELK